MDNSTKQVNDLELLLKKRLTQDLDDFLNDQNVSVADSRTLFSSPHLVVSLCSILILSAASFLIIVFARSSNINNSHFGIIAHSQSTIDITGQDKLNTFSIGKQVYVTPKFFSERNFQEIHTEELTELGKGHFEDFIQFTGDYINNEVQIFTSYVLWKDLNPSEYFYIDGSIGNDFKIETNNKNRDVNESNSKEEVCSYILTLDPIISTCGFLFTRL